MNKSWISAVAIMVSMVLVAGVVSAAPKTKTVGEWQDDPVSGWKQNIKILKEGSKYFGVSTFQDGSVRRAELSKGDVKGYRVFRVIGSQYGSCYVINSNGNLGLYDNDGYIREAKKVKR